MKSRVTMLALLVGLLLLVGLMSATTSVASAAERSPMLSDDALFSISGTVSDFDYGWPIEAAKIYDPAYPDQFAETDVNGAYVLTLPAGTYHLSTFHDNYWFGSGPVKVTVGPDQSGVDFTGRYLGYFYQAPGPLESAYVNQANQTTNYGLAPILRVKNAGTDMNSYVKFEVEVSQLPDSCVVETDVWLRLWVKEPSSDGGNVYAVSNNWNQNTLNWNNAPPILGAPLGSFGAVTDESEAWAYLGNGFNTGSIYSVAIRNESTNSVDYSSDESDRRPDPLIRFRYDYEREPTANFYADRYSSLAPLTVQFTDYSTGCPTSWEWDFGDGATSTEHNPSHTYTAVGDYSVTLTVTNSQGSDTITYNYISVVEQPGVFYISPSTNATIGGIPSQPADILRYIKATNAWTMVYDGSDHLTTKNVTAFAYTNGDLLLVFAANQVISGLGTATPYDVVRFTPDDPWTYPLGSGTYSWAFQGKTKGLTTSGEKIDAVDIRWAPLALSTTGVAAVSTNPVIKAADEDILGWHEEFGYASQFDGSAITGMAAEDINGFWYDGMTGDYYVTILGSFNLGGVVGDQKSIVRLAWNGNGYTTSIVPWLAPGAVFPSNIDAIDLAR